MQRLIDRLLSWLCDRVGLCLRFDGNLMAPDGTEEWWTDGNRA